MISLRLKTMRALQDNAQVATKYLLGGVVYIYIYDPKINLNIIVLDCCNSNVRN